MTNNFIKYLKRATMVVILSMTVFFSFTLSSYASENQGIDLSPKDEAVINNAQALWEAGDKTGARELLLGFIEAETYPISEDMYLVIGRISDYYERTDEAVKIYEKAYINYPESGKLLRAYAGMLFKNQQYAEAAPLLEKVYATSEKMEMRHLFVAAQAYFMAENPDKAKRLLKEIIDQPGVPKPYVFSMLYQICISLGEVDEANEYLEMYVSIAQQKLIPQDNDNKTSFPTAPIEGSLCQSEHNTNDEAPLKLKEVDSPPRVASILLPMYPIRASVEDIEGRVVLKFVVDRDGYVQEPEIFSSDPEGFFEESALDALIEYRFIPAMKDGKCVACIVRMPVVFQLAPDSLDYLQE